MATGKKYYWIKLKESFLTSDTIDYFMSLPNGADYVVLYQLLLLKTANTNGKLERQIGEMIIPYDIQKIQRDAKWFSADTVRVAVELFKRFGLIYSDENGSLVMAQHSEMVGSETDWAKQKREQIAKKKDTGVENVHTVSTQSPSDVHENVHIDIDIRDRDKILEIDKDIEKDIDILGTTTKRFTKPSVDEIKEYCQERGNSIDSEYFYDYYESRGWMVGKSKMKDWKAAVRTWERNTKKDTDIDWDNV